MALQLRLGRGETERQEAPGDTHTCPALRNDLSRLSVWSIAAECAFLCIAHTPIVIGPSAGRRLPVSWCSSGADTDFSIGALAGAAWSMSTSIASMLALVLASGGEASARAAMAIAEASAESSEPARIRRSEAKAVGAFGRSGRAARKEWKCTGSGNLFLPSYDFPQ